ncbi:MAG: glycine--tRNA ligase subunit beta, partial [Anaerolineae bacterium]|nr:glycine--tRNA ligase subunit beta [Anaerolineae bacterium]
ALYGSQVVPFEYAHVKSGNITRGVRPLGSPEIVLDHVGSYFRALEAQGVILDFEKRREAIRQQAQELAEAANGRIPDDAALLDEVTNLVEQPTALRGTFDERFLKLPREVLVTVMKKHQRYFAVEDEQGRLLPYFIAIRNGDAEHLDVVTNGNEHVLVARFTDAEFFYNADVKQPLEVYLDRLSTLTFQEKLGSMLDKNNRVAGMVGDFGLMLNAADDLIDIAQRAAQLLKADLGTQMVVEMTALQGTMGRIYAEQQGADPAVANAIYEHWLPRFAGDALPASAAGVLLSLLDRLDSLVGLFGVGLAPTGSADPFALRRAALGLLQILIDRDLELNLRGAVSMVARAQPVEVSFEHEQEVLEFIGGRFKAMLLEQGEPFDVVEAVLAEQKHNPARAMQGIQQLKTWTQHENWAFILDNFARCVRIIRNLDEIYELRPDDLTEPAEIALYKAYHYLINTLPLEYNIGDFLEAFAPLAPTISAFFDNLMVMAEDVKVRQNRLALLQALTALTRGRADLSCLTGF